MLSSANEAYAPPVEPTAKLCSTSVLRPRMSNPSKQVIEAAKGRNWTAKEGYWVRRGVTDLIGIYLAHAQSQCEWTVYKTFADFIESNLTYGTMVFAEGMMDILTLTSNGRVEVGHRGSKRSRASTALSISGDRPIELWYTGASLR